MRGPLHRPGRSRGPRSRFREPSVRSSRGIARESMLKVSLRRQCRLKLGQPDRTGNALNRLRLLRIASSSPLPAAAMGIVTACMGGLIRDVIAGVPSIMLRHELNVTAALLAASLFVGLTVLGVVAPWHPPSAPSPDLHSVVPQSIGD
jgi:glycine transporter